jgi:hypothetical protein
VVASPAVRQLLLSGRGFSPLPGLVSYWNLENTADAYGANGLTNNNSVTFAAGKVGNAAVFSAASSQYLSVASNAGLLVGGVDWWLAAWLNITSGANPTLASKAASGLTSGRSWVLQYNSPGFLATVSDGTTAVSATTGAFSFSAWHFLVAYYDAATKKVAVSLDGGAFALSAALPNAQQDSSSFPFNLGTDKSGGGNFMNGSVDAVAFGNSPPGGVSSVINKVRDTLYNNGSGRSWPF